MKTLVVYDSTHGNTEKVALAVGQAAGCPARRVNDASPADLEGCDLLIVGSPTHGGWYTEGMRDWLLTLPEFAGMKVAVFDTRTKKSIFGFAAPRLARKLEKNGAKLITSPEGFVVLGIKGPLEEGEIERAAGWGKGLAG